MLYISSELLRHHFTCESLGLYLSGLYRGAHLSSTSSSHFLNHFPFFLSGLGLVYYLLSHLACRHRGSSRILSSSVGRPRKPLLIYFAAKRAGPGYRPLLPKLRPLSFFQLYICARACCARPEKCAHAFHRFLCNVAVYLQDQEAHGRYLKMMSFAFTPKSWAIMGHFAKSMKNIPWCSLRPS